MNKLCIAVLVLVLAGCGETQSTANPKFNVGNIVIHRASGERGVVTNVWCRAVDCRYQVANRIEKQTWCAEVELERAKE